VNVAEILTTDSLKAHLSTVANDCNPGARAMAHHRITDHDASLRTALDAAVKRAERAEEAYKDKWTVRSLDIQIKPNPMEERATRAEADLAAMTAERDGLFKRLHAIIGIAEDDEGPPEDEWSIDDPAGIVTDLRTAYDAAIARCAELVVAVRDYCEWSEGGGDESCGTIRFMRMKHLAIEADVLFPTEGSVRL
jgi:hypothetical protein